MDASPRQTPATRSRARTFDVELPPRRTERKMPPSSAGSRTDREYKARFLQGATSAMQPSKPPRPNGHTPLQSGFHQIDFYQIDLGRTIPGRTKPTPNASSRPATKIWTTIAIEKPPISAINAWHA